MKMRLPFLILLSLLLILVAGYALRSIISPQISYTWQKKFGRVDYPPWDNWDEAHSIQQTTDGGYVVAGYTATIKGGPPDIHILKLNFKGEIF